jgi:hypothetical protein
LGPQKTTRWKKQINSTKNFRSIYQSSKAATLLSKRTPTKKQVHVFREKETEVKKIALRSLLLMIVLVASGSTPVLADGGFPAPTCTPTYCPGGGK